YEMLNDLKSECMNEEGKFWGVIAAPIQSTGDPERRWQRLSYFRGIKGLNTIKARKFALK
ncbi:hypothetical protein ACC763_39625, partial [Rhizobium ruizarguesonis]